MQSVNIQTKALAALQPEAGSIYRKKCILMLILNSGVILLNGSRKGRPASGYIHDARALLL